VFFLFPDSSAGRAVDC